ncbi:tRNA pseudouridine38-40 synthase [Chitinophaga terrae (ex Kim and Jung 2007)]|uniref:tRNA pseudouridine synthase A n=1 Tax=Chitinophaga terrae (ex Kim and Jung 2007) TaxID=408074 RepID=A0A1H3YBZ2_9BACT|nr:tRNA pseudouridine(38-40) synthase TruA [Chitinophaga terrae (ex Kim and Jung 2007)]MDQ0107894.1 tRNA pseudouridine38-40 synthase [Chitinophaga terrae (ex Kim and Jung 2007)]GEP90825.1 tRNA pseudouridine synthase A [Chitinophaga terrae (ex Kim and Jung 2007)]SEA09076.1 tRNA pseudouridine38-40 synthase [Chitinophaga terrae (ex Kim and Jung 2007)]
MNRYFIEVAYKGAAYSGFQVQENAHTVQAEVDRALSILFRETIVSTGSSRTDAGVNAYQNFLHFDTELPLHPQFIYKINAILPDDVVLNGVYAVPPDANSRFAALSRAYEYTLYTKKDPFLQDRGYFFPYRLDIAALQEAASIITEYTDFTTFSKRNTQVKTFLCNIMESQWSTEGHRIVYNVKANRFLRGMVRGLVGTMLRVGRGKLSLSEFRAVIESKDCTRADFAVPPQGLFLMQVNYPDRLLEPIHFKR